MITTPTSQTKLASRHRLLTAFLFLICAGSVGVALDSLRHIGIANADTAPVLDAGVNAVDLAASPAPVPVVIVAPVAHAAAQLNPVPDLQVAVDSGWAIVEHDGPILGGGAILFCLIGAFLRRNNSTHWIAQGRVLALITGLGMTLGAILDWKLNGGQLAGVIMTVIAAVKLALSPAVGLTQTGPAIDSKPAAPAGGGNSLIIVALIAIGVGSVAAMPACSQVKDVGAATIDCTKLDHAKITALASHLASEVAEYVVLAKPIDWHALRLEAQDAGLDIGLCAFGPLVNNYLAPSQGRAVPDSDSAQRAHAEFEALRAAAGGATVHTQEGNL